MNAQRRMALALTATALAAVVLAVLDVGGPVRSVVSLGFLLVCPGLALSLLMGTMSPEARLLVSLAASAALTTVVSLALLAAGLWSGGLGFGLLALWVLIVSTRTWKAPPTAVDTPTAASTSTGAATTRAGDPTAEPPDEHHVGLRQEIARRTT